MAGTLSERDICSSAGHEYGGTNKIPVDCYQMAILNASSKTKDHNHNNTIIVVGIDNLLFIETKEETSNSAKIFAISGEKSGLNRIVSISLAPDSKEVAILNENMQKEMEILFFPTNRNGNIKPRRIIKNDAILNADTICFHPKKRRIFVSSSVDKTVLVFQSESNSRSFKEYVKPKVRGKLERLPASSNIMVTDKFLLILNSERKKVMAFDLDLKKDKNLKWISDELPEQFINHK